MKEQLIEPLDKEQLNELAQQLRCPDGKKGKSIGDLLNNSNKEMIEESIITLDIHDKNRILELGHGNCSHLSEIMKQANKLKYFGMEISQVMQQEATRINYKYIKKKVALFYLYNGNEIPYVLNFFDKIITVNTIYFWENPLGLLNEIYRVLKPNGIFVLTFATSSFMKKLPFVSETNVFRLYDISKLEILVSKTNFKLENIKNKTERVKDKTEGWVDREYSIAVLRKKEKKINLR
tara:strand:+ start:7427 stop:8134 length:708 start_codon:yes stop_codon:yes gene_type:complete